MNIRQMIRNNPPVVVAAVILVAASLIGGIGCNGTKEPDTSPKFNKNYRLIFPHTASAPVIDGLITVSGNPLVAESAWDDSFAIDLDENEGSPIHESLMRGVVDDNNIYLYLEVEDTGFDATDTLVLAFNPSATDNDYRLLILRPCVPATVCTGGSFDNINIGEFLYYTGSESGGTITWTQQPLGSHGVTAKAAVALTKWSVELSIPRAGSYHFPDVNYFGFYANIIETDPNFNPFPPANESFATQHTWPFDFEGDAEIAEVTQVDTNLPASTVWGHASLSTNIGNGVRISSSDIYTNHGPSTISWNQPNTFYAMAHNNTLNASNTLVTAHNVRATFKWANFGLPSYESFQRIPTETAPAAGNPTLYTDIGPTQSQTYSLDWTVPVADQDFYQDHPHWCLRVELDSSDASTVFYSASAQHNMNFVETSSPFTGEATVATQGYRLPEEHRLYDFYLEEHFYNTSPELKWESRIAGINATNRPGRYLISVPPEKSARLDLSILPPMQAVPVGKDVEIKAATDGSMAPATAISIQPGQLVTVIVDEAAIKPMATGMDTAATREPTVPPRQTLMGSWDNFEQSKFALGYSVTLKAPKGARALSLALIGDRQADGGREDHAWNARVIVSDLKNYNLAANSSLAINRAQDQRVALGANLPTVVYRGKRFTDRTITIRKQKFRLYEDSGSFGYIVKGHKR